MNFSQYQDEVIDYAKSYIDDDGVEDYDDFDSWLDDYQDSITGNDNGSFYCNSAKAEEALQGILFDEKAIKYCKDLGYDGIPTEKGPEACDVIIRYAALYTVLGDITEYWYEVKEKEVG